MIDDAPATFLATRRGKLTLALLCLAGGLDFVDNSIVTVALPSIRHQLHFSVQSLQWVVSGYFLTYGGVILLGGGGRAPPRLCQGTGAAMMTPAALSILTTSFDTGTDRTRALGAWGAASGLAAALGVIAGGLLSEGPGWR